MSLVFFTFMCLHFQLKYWKASATEQDSVYYLSRYQRPWAIVVGLQPDTQYYVKVMAYNSAGEGPESERFLGKSLGIKFLYVSPAHIRCYCLQIIFSLTASVYILQQVAMMFIM